MKNHCQLVLLFTVLVFFASVIVTNAANETDLTWGVSALTLKPDWTGSPALSDILTNQSHTVALNQFYRAGGANQATTPTECLITSDPENLLVVFRCSESNLSWPATNQPGNWYSLLRSPVEQDSTFPDKVDCFIKPDLNQDSFYEFTATLNGLKFGVKCKSHPAPAAKAEDDPENGSSSVTKVNDFEATVTTQAGEWIVFFKIPWKTLGGRPADSFGFLPERTRWRDGEISSPVAVGFDERPPADLFIETHFAGGPATAATPTSLCQLPSGALRWQRPAWLNYPDPETLRQIWGMQQSLNHPTDKDNLARRLYLTQRWIDLLTLEGFSFSVGSGSIVPHDLKPYALRRSINHDLQKGNLDRAAYLLDDWLNTMNGVSRKWFADGSPGDILTGEWQPVSRIESAEIKDNVLFLHGLAADHPVELQLSLPETGGVRLHGPNQGYFQPDKLLPLSSDPSASVITLPSADGRIVLTRNPFTISFYDPAGKLVTQIGAGRLAFRFDSAGKIRAVDFKNDLEPDEVVHGFGEKYDHFNENGNVLTLWGVDDWTGNTVGLMNASYKPIPIFHSSKGYMVFDNSSYRLRADIGKTNPKQYRLTQQGPVFDYYFWFSTPEKALASYTSLTGKPFLPPRWAFEPWMGRTGRGWNNTPAHNPVAEEEKVVARFAKLDIPHSAIYAEGNSADSAVLNNFMAAHGLKVLSWYFPAISRKAQASLMPELKSAELPIMNTGSTNRATDPDYVDFTNPNALELSRRWWKHRLDIGVAGSMIDFGDRVPETAVFYNGVRGDEMHNFYTYAYHQTYAAVFREKRGDDFILFGRAAAPGTQKWVAQFGGDHPSTLAGLRGVLTGALNLSGCGFSIWGSDLGGFLGWPEPAVYMRWTQFGCFSPLMRCHGRTPREPWNYGDAAVANYKNYTWVRENLLDYIYDAAVDSHATGIPMMRSLAIAFPDQPLLAAVGDQYMFGRDLLVAPVITEENSRSISFPTGGWTSLWDGHTVAGPATVKIAVPLDTIPVYLKPGAVVPVRLNQNLQFGASLTPGLVHALVLTPPQENEQMSLSDGKSDATVILRPTTGGFTIMLKNLGATRCLLVYGAHAASVKMGGKAMPASAGNDFASASPDWRNDAAIRRVIIRLPPGKDSAAEIRIELEPVNQN